MMMTIENFNSTVKSQLPRIDAHTTKLKAVVQLDLETLRSSLEWALVASNSSPDIADEVAGLLQTANGLFAQVQL